MNIGQNILNLRKGANLSQEQLAEIIGVTRQTISNWELEESSPDLKQAKELSRFFNVSLDDFYRVIDKMTQCWLSNGRLEEYLRPITLFGDKFEEYLEGNWERNEVDWS